MNRRQNMERRENIIATFNRLKAAILNLWERVKEPVLELTEALKEIHTAFITLAEKRRRQYIAVENFQKNNNTAAGKRGKRH